MNASKEIKYLRLDDIIPNRLQPRTEFDEEKLNELASSIKQYGVINPLLVRVVGNKYEIIAGERRYKASKLAGLSQVPAIVTNIDDNTSAEIAIIENIQRQNLSALEEAKSYRKLLDLGNLTQEQLAHKMGKNQSTIANKMRLLNLCDEVQEALENNQISERHARSLLQLKNVDDQRNVLEKIINEKMTVKNTENFIKEILQNNLSQTPQEIIENNIIPPSIKEDNIYGNDIVNIMELNKKELEKESENMNNNEQNMQFNQQNTMMDIPTKQPQMMTQAPTTPAFGDRFFPSLEDQPTNVNLNNPFDTIPTPTPQPMMENLVDPTPVVNIPDYPQPEPMPQVSNVVPEPTNIPAFVTSNQIVTPTINPLDNIAPIPTTNNQNTNEVPNIEQPSPMVSNDFIPNNMPPPSFEIPQPTNNIVASSPIPTTNNVIEELSPIIPQPEQAPLAPQLEPMSEISPLPQQNQQVIPPVEIKNNDKIINAINAIKNLALSIESVGYKLTINEEDTPNIYKINIELDK